MYCIRLITEKTVKGDSQYISTTPSCFTRLMECVLFSLPAQEISRRSMSTDTDLTPVSFSNNVDRALLDTVTLRNSSFTYNTISCIARRSDYPGISMLENLPTIICSLSKFHPTSLRNNRLITPSYQSLLIQMRFSPFELNLAFLSNQRPG